MYNVTNPKTGKTYVYGSSKLVQAQNLAAKLGVSIEVVGAGVDECGCGSARCAGCDDVFDAMRDRGAFDADYYGKRYGWR